MVSFDAKQVEKRMRKRENKNFHSVPFPTHNRNFQKNSKKILKFKKYLYGSFEAKIGWRRMRKRENKNYHSVPTRLLIENSKNIQKIKKYHCGFISRQNRLEKAEKEKNKNYRFVSFQPNA